MTTLGQILDRDKDDAVGAAAKQLGRVDPRLRVAKVAVDTSDFGALRQIDVGDLLHAGWHDLHALRLAGHETLAGPATATSVAMDKLTLAFHYDPSLDVYVNGQYSFSVSFGLDVVVNLVELFATIAHGCLTGVQVQAMMVSVELGAAGRSFSSKPVHVAPEQEIRIGSGIPLVKGARCGEPG